MKTRVTALALALVLLLAMASTALALPDNYKHYCPEPFEPYGWIGGPTKSENPFLNSSGAQIFAKFVPETCSIWVWGRYELAMYDDDGNVILDNEGFVKDFGALKHLCVFRYTEDKRVIEMVAYEHAYKCHQKGAELPITAPGRYFAAVCDIFGYYKVWPGKDFIITEDMLIKTEEVTEEIE